MSFDLSAYDGYGYDSTAEAFVGTVNGVDVTVPLSDLGLQKNSAGGLELTAFPGTEVVSAAQLAEFPSASSAATATPGDTSDSSSSKLEWWVWLIIAVSSLLLIALVAFYVKKRKGGA
jgi:hypothetical protein